MQLSKGDLVDPLKALEMGQPGDIIVVDAGGETETSVCGGLMGGLAKNRGIRGMIVDGAGRDIDELEDIGWPIWTRAITPRGTHTMFSGPQGGAVDQRPDHLRRRRRCSPGDFVVADTIGVTVVPLGRAEEVLELAREQARAGAEDAGVGRQGQDGRGPACRVRQDLMSQLARTSFPPGLTTRIRRARRTGSRRPSPASPGCSRTWISTEVA